MSTELLVARLSTGIISLKNPGQKLQKTKNGTLRWYTNGASQDTLQNQIDHSDQKVLRNRYGIPNIQTEVKVLGRKEKAHERIYSSRYQQK